MKVPEGLQKEILRTLYKAYPKRLQVKEFSQSMPGHPGEPQVFGACLYLEDKGRLARTDDGWRISASGIDFLEEKNLV